MQRIFDLAALPWRLSGYYPEEWRLGACEEVGVEILPEVGPIKATVPGSVQKALLENGFIPDWNIGLNAQHCEWIENRWWVFETNIPDKWLAHARQFVLHCKGLDGFGSIWVNKTELYSFRNAFIPHRIDITPALASSNNVLQIVFTCSPRWLGQCGCTSKMTEWKPRFNYRWDWTARLVQIGIWDDLTLEAVDAAHFESCDVSAVIDPAIRKGLLTVHGIAVNCGTSDSVRIELLDNNKIMATETVPAATFNAHGVMLSEIDAALWYPNGLGEPRLYQLRAVLFDSQGRELDTKVRSVGFRTISWQQCQDAPAGADPWICVVNGTPIFMQGANWTPIRPNFADVPESEYRKRLTLYRDLGFNLFRVWGGGFLEKECFYRLCDELGLMVWQEFPLSSSGIENYPPDDEASMDELVKTAQTYIHRRKHHACLILWCGGNELMAAKQGQAPVGLEHALMRRFSDCAAKLDPHRRFIASSPSGPRFCANKNEFGKGLHWDIHGPWRIVGKLEDDWIPYWQADDALLRSEVGAPGASDGALIQRYQGECDILPISTDNALWRRFSWWCERKQFDSEHGHGQPSLEAYVAWSQKRQADALYIAADTCKRRFPRCGGIVVWMGHDSFPCTANTSIIDFEGRPKPAAIKLAEIFLHAYPKEAR